MRGQVHLVELAALAVVTFLCFLIGFSLPLVGGLALVLWPLLLLNMILSWVGARMGLALRHRWRKGRPEAPARRGVARFIWLAPLASLALGYGLYVVTSGRWFL